MGTLHVVSHTHWDREWYLPFQAFRIRLVHLIDLLLELLAHDPAYRHFTLDGQTVVLDDYLEIRPERRAELEAHVRAGRLLIGPWMVLPDEFLVSPEALIRNLERGIATARRFGAWMPVGYVPDPFGHVGQLPQILRGFGIEAAAFRRGLAEEPCELTWEAPDGSRVLVAYLREGYDNAARLPEDKAALGGVLRARRDALARHSAVSSWLLMNGTDHHEPQPGLPGRLDAVELPGDVLRLSTLPAYLDAVRAEIDARAIELPVVRGELRSPARHHLLPGVLSSRVALKQRNDACETLLECWAEPFAAFAERVCDGPDRAVFTGHTATPRVRDASGLLAEAWRLLLLCQPHDSICGCSIDAVHDEMPARFDQVEQIAGEVVRQSLVALGEEVDTRALERLGARGALVVFGSARGAGAERARARFELPAGLEHASLATPEGVPVPFRVLERHVRPLADFVLGPRELPRLLRAVRRGGVLGFSVRDAALRHTGGEVSLDLVVGEGAQAVPGGARHAAASGSGAAPAPEVAAAADALEALLERDAISRCRVRARLADELSIELLAPELPPLGYRALALLPAAGPPPAPREDDGDSIENEWLRAEVAADGSLSLVDKRRGTTLDGLLRLRDVADRGDSYNFCPVEGDAGVETAGDTLKRRRERGAWGDALELCRTLTVPARLAPGRLARSDERVALPFTLRLELAPGVPRLEVTLELENRAEDHRLELLFPLPGPARSAHYGGHFEIVERPTALPAPQPSWVEQPRPEQPMRGFVAAHTGRGEGAVGLLVAARGLREARVSPDGVLSVTLLRCTGWLSRDDLATRRGGAGPTLPTPGGQCAGPHRFELALVPCADDALAASEQARRFRATPRGVGAPLGPGRLPLSGSLLRADARDFAWTAVRTSRDGRALLARGVNLAGRPLRVRAACLLPLRAAGEVRLDETPLRELDVENEHEVAFEVGPHALATLRLETRAPS